MRSLRATSVMLLLLGAAAIVAAGAAVRSRRAVSPVVELAARAPEHGGWSPQSIHIAGIRPVTLVIRNTDVVTHGFYLPAFGISIPRLEAGETRRLTLAPTRRGTFPFYCTVWCSAYHMHMRGELIIE